MTTSEFYNRKSEEKSKYQKSSADFHFGTHSHRYVKHGFFLSCLSELNNLHLCCKFLLAILNMAAIAEHLGIKISRAKVIQLDESKLPLSLKFKIFLGVV